MTSKPTDTSGRVIKITHHSHPRKRNAFIS